MRRMILISVLITVGILAIIGGGAYWFFNNYNYYTTDDAQVTGPIVNLSSPAAGSLTAFTAKIGDNVTAGQVIATVTAATATGNTVVNVTSPISGTIIQSSAVQGQAVSPGLSLAQVADLNSLQITAYVDEGAINNVKTGQDVDIHIDAFGGTTYTGHVQRIVQAAAGIFSLIPASDPTSGNFTKVGQRIPVIITLDGTGGNDVVPGMSAEVTIHLH